MPQSSADALSQVPMSEALRATFDRAFRYARSQFHRRITLEHLLLALAEDPDATLVMTACAVDIERLSTDASGHIGRLDDRYPMHAPGEPVPDPDLLSIVHYAGAAAQQSRRRGINGAIVLAAIVGEGRSVAASMLRAQGLTFEAAIKALPKATPTARPAAESAAQAGAPPRAAPQSAEEILATVRERIQASRPSAAPKPVDQGPVRAPEPHPSVAPAPAAAPPPPPPQPQAYEPPAQDAEFEPAAPVAAPAPPRPQPPALPPALPPAPRQVERQVPPPVEYSGEEPYPEPISRADQAPPDAARRASPPHVPPPPPPVYRQTDAEQTDQPRTAPPPPPAPAYPAERRPDQAAPYPPHEQYPPAYAPSYPPTPERPREQYPAPEAASAGPVPQPGAPPPLDRGWQPDRPTAGRPAHPPSEQVRPPFGQPPYPPNPFANAPQPAQPRPMAAAPPPPVTGRTLPPRQTAPGGGGMAAPVAAPPQQPAPRQGNWAMQPGQLVENIPRSMMVGVTDTVEVRIARAELSALGHGMDGRGAPVRHDLIVTRAMSVRLRAPDGGFFIETVAPETQWVENRLGIMSEDFASWRWAVTPQARGIKRLQLVVSARTVGTDGLAAETQLPDQFVDVKIATNFSREGARWGGWAAAAIAGGILARFGEGFVALALSVIGRG